MFVTAHPGYRSCDITVMLKKIEMSPGHLFEIMGMTRCATYRARILGSSASLKG
jgi:hypothetical protein